MKPSNQSPNTHTAVGVVISTSAKDWRRPASGIAQQPFIVSNWYHSHGRFPIPPTK